MSPAAADILLVLTGIAALAILIGWRMSLQPAEKRGKHFGAFLDWIGGLASWLR